MGSEVGGLGLIPPGSEHSVRLVHRGESVQTGSNVSPQNEASEHRPARPRSDLALPAEAYDSAVAIGRGTRAPVTLGPR
jgi:hypothetical protein